MILILLYSMLNATTYTFSKALLAYGFPMLQVALRSIIACSLFLAYQLYKKNAWPKPSKNEWLFIIQVAFFSFFIGFALLFWSLEATKSAKVALLYSCFSPLIAALFSYMFFQEKFTIKKSIGLLLIFIASLPTFFSQELTGSDLLCVSCAELYIFWAAAAFSYGSILLRKGLRKQRMPYITFNIYVMIIGSLMALMFSYFFEFRYAAMPFAPDRYFWLLIITSSIVTNIICYVLYSYLLKYFTATLVGISDLLTPLFALIFGWFFLHETVSCSFFVTLIFLIIGMHIFYQEEKRLGYYI